MHRRGFLALLLRSLVASATSVHTLRVAAVAAEAAAAAPTPAPSPEAGLVGAEWKTVVAVQDHLLPAESDSPGAREIHAAGYLRLVLVDPRTDPAVLTLVRAGVIELEKICRDAHGMRFAALATDQRETALRALEASPRGREWLGEMLEFLMEALLGDPSHGGNPGGIGWKWLGIVPGFPRPRPGRLGDGV